MPPQEKCINGNNRPYTKYPYEQLTIVYDTRKAARAKKATVKKA